VGEGRFPCAGMAWSHVPTAPCLVGIPLIRYSTLQRLMHGMRVSALVAYQAQIGGPCALLMSHIPGKRCSKHLRSVPQEGSAMLRPLLVGLAAAALALIIAACSSASPASTPRPCPSLERSPSYQSLFRNIGRYEGCRVSWDRAEVVQVLGDHPNYQLRIAITEGEWTFSDVIYVYYYNAPVRPLEGDVIKLSAVVDGTVTYESIFGQEITVPAVIATSFSLPSAPTPVPEEIYSIYGIKDIAVGGRDWYIVVYEPELIDCIPTSSYADPVSYWRSKVRLLNETDLTWESPPSRYGFALIVNGVERDDSPFIFGGCKGIEVPDEIGGSNIRKGMLVNGEIRFEYNPGDRIEGVIYRQAFGDGPAVVWTGYSPS